jgi:hypothetical protein
MLMELMSVVHDSRHRSVLSEIWPESQLVPWCREKGKVISAEF